MSAKTLPILNDHDALRPRTFGDCLRDGWGDDGTPCPWVSCAHHLVWARATRGGSRGFSSPEPGEERSVDRLESLLSEQNSPWLLDELPATCALRVAEEPRPLTAIAKVFGTAASYMQQLEAKAFKSLGVKGRRRVLAAMRDVQDLDELARHAAAATTEHAWRTAESESKPEEMVAMKPEADKESGARAFAALVSYAERRGVARSAAERELRLSSSTVARFRGAGCSPALADRITAALAALPEGDAAEAAPKAKAKAKPARRKTKQVTAKPAPSKPATSTLTLDQLPRVLAIVERLGGIERAERIAAAIGGAL